jgi:hypothetical protein
MWRVFLFAAFALKAAAAPKRLEGYSYGRIELERGLSDETAEFNDSFDHDDEPEKPHYLDEEGNDARSGAPVGEDKYKLAPVYSLQTLYDIDSGKIDSPFDSDDEEDEEEVGEEEDEEEF